MHSAAAHPSAPRSSSLPRFARSFRARIGAALALIAAGDLLFFRHGTGATLGLFALVVLTAMATTRPAILRNAAPRAAAAAALVFAAALADDPSLLAAGLFWAAALSAALLPRQRLENGLRWAKRLLQTPFASIAEPSRNWRAARRARGRGAAPGLGASLPLLAVPVAGSALFLLLFASANPIIGDAFDRVDPGMLFGGFSFLRPVFWLLLGIGIWSLLRPAMLRPAPIAEPGEVRALPGIGIASVTLSLVTFNLIFALQNGLDLVFLWSNAPLPDGMTLAQYAHRGAYPLIATALLAGAFVLLALRPGSEMAASPLIRRMVYLWIGQNVLLVASTMLRTADYIDAFSLTRLRIAALVWMALVAVGLLLICYRVWRDKGGIWLVNANLAAAAAALTGCAFVDLGAAAASWNVRHTREVGGNGSLLDLCYLNRLGASALLPMIELESRPIGPVLRARVAWSRGVQYRALEAEQADWRRWTFRGHRRLAEARRLIAERRLPPAPQDERGCNGLGAAPALTAPLGG
ncbi:MAG TPA: DUF4173 domain-containing protein [Allosphingosinicella sp.]|nr:DUF4173 domain-containing protein [Allosphingosinicella sp.]